MTKLPRLSGKEVVKALLRGGFTVTHIRGSHYYLRKDKLSGLVVVPVHGKNMLPPGTLQSILRQANLAIENLQEFMK